MAKVALVIPPFFWTKTPHIGIEFLIQALKRKHKVDLFDLNMASFQILRKRRSEWDKLGGEKAPSLFQYLKSSYPRFIDSTLKSLKKYDLVGISVFRRNRAFSLRLAEELENSGFSGRLILGGPEVSFIKDFCGQKVIGEGERAIAAIAQGESKDFLFWETDNLDSLPLLEFRKFNLRAFPRVLPLLSSRGCIRRCRFCTEWRLYKKFRQHTPAYIVAQMKKLWRDYKIDWFSFQDSLINASLGWLEEFGRRLSEENLPIRWEAQMIIRDDMTTDLLALLQKAGCTNIFFGLESASEKVLKDMGKPFCPQEALSLFTRLTGLSLHFEISLIIGYPTETEEDFLCTLSFLKENKKLIPKIAQVNPFILLENSLLKEEGITPLPQTIVKKRMKKVLKLIKNEGLRHRLSFINNLADGN